MLSSDRHTDIIQRDKTEIIYHAASWLVNDCALYWRCSEHAMYSGYFFASNSSLFASESGTMIGGVKERRRKSRKFRSLNSRSCYSWNASNAATNLATVRLARSVVNTASTAKRAFRFDLSSPAIYVTIRWFRAPALARFSVRPLSAVSASFVAILISYINTASNICTGLKWRGRHTRQRIRSEVGNSPTSYSTVSQQFIYKHIYVLKGMLRT